MAAGEPILLRIGATTLPASPGVALAPAIEAANARNRIEGVPDALNPGIIDAGKAAGFVASLPNQPAETLARMTGHELSLNQGGLGLLAAAPTLAADFTAPFNLVIDDIQGRHILAHTTVSPNPGLARTHAAEARKALATAEKDVRQAEARQVSDEINATRGRRGAIASAWHIGARAWAAASSDAEAQSNLAAARTAARAYVRPSGDVDG